jgi:hypothetical protein
MLVTVETRWFLEGPLPPEVLRWFQRDGASVKPAHRIDRYLLAPGCTAIGMKLREGRFEVKRRDKDLGVLRLAPGVTGRLALWRKWGFQVSGAQSDSPDENWVGVEKERWLRKFVTQGSALKEIDANDFGAGGCSIELTRLAINGEPWWSIGLESVGEPPQAREELQSVAAHFFESGGDSAPPALSLQVEDSLDYPEWLASFSREPITRR